MDVVLLMKKTTTAAKPKDDTQRAQLGVREHE
jgi:hypothetical protein